MKKEIKFVGNLHKEWYGMGSLSIDDKSITYAVEEAIVEMAGDISDATKLKPTHHKGKHKVVISIEVFSKKELEDLIWSVLCEAEDVPLEEALKDELDWETPDVKEKVCKALSFLDLKSTVPAASSVYDKAIENLEGEY